MKNPFFRKAQIRWFPALLGVIALAWVMPGNAAAQKGGSPDLSTAIIRVAKDNIPAVVHIEVTRSQEARRPTMPFEGDPFFRFFQDPQRSPGKFKREMRGLGTGMITDAQGHILTNNHVVGGASKVQVLLADGSRFEARVVGTDPKTDLAIVKIDAKKALPHVKFGNSDAVEVGEWVVAIGHPRGLDQTVTTGIISAKHRRGITDPSGYQDFLQTDAAINPGNSGGPLLNLSPDRRGHQPRKQRRAPAEPAGRGRRGECRHRLHIWRLRGYRFCDPQQHGPLYLPRTHRQGKGGAGLARSVRAGLEL